MRLLIVAALILAALSAAVWSVVTPAGATTPDHPGTGRLVQCAAEGDNGCVWDARHAGNGVGRSYVATPDGKVIPVPHYVAHALIHG